LCLSILRKVCCSDLSVCLSLYLSLYRSICLCVSLSIYLPMFAHTLSIVCFTQHLLSIEGFTQHLSIYPCSHTHTPDKTMQIYNLCKCVWGGGGGYALGVKGAVARKGCGSCLSYSKIKNIQYEALSLSIYIYISLSFSIYLSISLSQDTHTHPQTHTHTHTHTHTNAISATPSAERFAVPICLYGSLCHLTSPSIAGGWCARCHERDGR
jgi:hypothetical protein